LQLLCQPGQHLRGGAGAGHHDGLFVQGLPGGAAGGRSLVPERMDLGEQPPEPVGQLVHLGGEVFVEPGERGQLRGLLVIGAQGPQRMRHRTSRLSDDRCVSGVGLRLSRMQVSDPPHRQPR
jgi:hypothetical protein